MHAVDNGGLACGELRAGLCVEDSVTISVSDAGYINPPPCLCSRLKRSPLYLESKHKKKYWARYAVETKARFRRHMGKKGRCGLVCETTAFPACAKRMIARMHVVGLVCVRNICLCLDDSLRAKRRKI